VQGLMVMKNVVESDDRFFPRMIDHVSKAASEPCQDREACLIRPHLFILRCTLESSLRRIILCRAFANYFLCLQ
jgi:hypothetical protein